MDVLIDAQKRFARAVRYRKAIEDLRHLFENGLQAIRSLEADLKLEVREAEIRLPMEHPAGEMVLKP